MPLLPKTIDEVLRYAQMVITANAVPDSLTKEAGRPLPDKEIISRVVSVIAAGSEVGLAPMTSLAQIAIINKKRHIWGAGAIALIQAKGLLEWMRVERTGPEPTDTTPTQEFRDDFGVVVSLKRKGQDEPYVGKFTVGDAKRLHLWMVPAKRPWIESPERMLYWRAFHFAATKGFSDALNGMGIRDGIEDAPPPPRATDLKFLDAPSDAPEQE